VILNQAKNFSGLTKTHTDVRQAGNVAGKQDRGFANGFRRD
jgi:hypothetical protein